MKCFVRFRKYFWLILVAIILLLAFLIDRCQRSNSDAPYYRKHWSEFSKTCNSIEFENGRMQIENNSSNYYISEYRSWISAPSETDTLSVFALKGKRGYLNLLTGEPQIQPIYRHAWPFSEGLAAVDSGGRIGFINASGETCIPFKFFSQHPFRHVADYVFSGGYCSMLDTCGKYGLIDRKGRWVLSPVYDFVNNPLSGLRIVKYDGKYGLMDASLHLILPFEYTNIEVLKSGIKAAKGGGQQLLSLDAKHVLKPFVCDMVSAISYYSDELDSTGYPILKQTGYYAYNIYTKWGLMGPDGKPLTKAIYSDFKGLSKTRFIGEIGSSCVILDTKGRECN